LVEGNIFTFVVIMKMSTTFVTAIHKWRLKHLNERQLTLIASLIVGLLSGFAAVVLKNIIHLASLLLTENFKSSFESYQYLIYPGIGILLTVLFIKFFVKTDINHGITKVLESISRQKSRIKSHNMFTSMISSTITIGFGGSVGAEAPVVLTGSAIGSKLTTTR